METTVLSSYQNAGQNRNINTAKISFENVEQFKYLETTATIQNWIQEKIKGGLNSGNYCSDSVQNILSSRLLSKNVNGICRIIILPVALYGCETWSPTLREEHRLRVFENRVLMRIFGPERERDRSLEKTA
jgi:hypothetical protein